VSGPSRRDRQRGKVKILAAYWLHWGTTSTNHGKSCRKKNRDWILFTDETPVVPVYPEYSFAQTQEAIEKGEEPHYMGTFSSAKRYILQSFATTQTPRTKKRVSQFMQISQCPDCNGKKLKRESLSALFDMPTG